MIMKKCAPIIIALAIAFSPIAVSAQTQAETIAEMRENLALAVIALTQNDEFSLALLNNLIRVYNERMGTVGVTLSGETMPDPAPTTEEKIDPVKERLIALNTEIKELDAKRLELIAEANERAEKLGGSNSTIAAYKRVFSEKAVGEINDKLKELRLERRNLSFEYCGMNLCILD